VDYICEGKGFDGRRERISGVNLQISDEMISLRTLEKLDVDFNIVIDRCCQHYAGIIPAAYLFTT
jgi:hypothetical protein